MDGYRDGDWVSNIRIGVIAGVFRNKGAAPWGITRAEKLKLSVFLPNDLSLDDWYAGVYALPTVWPEASMLGDDYLRKVAGYDFHLLRKKPVALWLKPFWLKPFGSRIRYLTSTNVDSKGKIQARCA